MTVVVEPCWRPAPRAARLATVAVTALAFAFVTGHGDLLALAAGPIALLAMFARTPPPDHITASVTLSGTRCVEGDPVTLTVAVRAEPPVDRVTAQIIGPPGVTVTTPTGQGGTLTATLIPRRWGTPRLSVRVGAYATFQLRHTDVDLDLGRLTVLPRAPRLRASPAQTALLARLGEHPSRFHGSGVEFAGIRDLLPGEPVRDLNWAATSRRRRPLVNERSSERAADLVIAVDAFADLGVAGRSTVDDAVRGAVALAHAALRYRDRVGVIVLGGVLRGLTPGSGERQFYRVSEAVLAARSLIVSAVRPDLTRLPRPALPPGSLVVLFSPLVDERVFAVLRDLRQRRVRTEVVDVLRTPPPGHNGGPDLLALRVLRLDRAADRLVLARLGVPVVAWSDRDELDVAIAPLARQRHQHSGRPV